MKLISVTLAALGAALLFLAGTFYALLASVAILFEPDLWYFPGDPPMADLGVGFAIMALAEPVDMRCPGRRKWRLPGSNGRDHDSRRYSTLVLSALLPGLVMANRHFGEWAQFRRCFDR